MNDTGLDRARSRSQKKMDALSIAGGTQTWLTRPPTKTPRKRPLAPGQSDADIELTTFESWEKVAQWYAKLENGRVDPTPEIRAKTLAIDSRAGDLNSTKSKCSMNTFPKTFAT